MFATQEDRELIEKQFRYTIINYLFGNFLLYMKDPRYSKIYEGKRNMIAYLYKWITRQMLNADPEAGKTISAQLMQKIYQAFTDESGKKKNLFSYQLHEEKNSDVRRICIMDHLRFEDGILFGSIGIMTDEVDGMIRERDIVTFEESKITPSGPNKKFEYFTFFSIYPGKEHFLILKNGNMPSYIDNGHL